MYDKIYLIDSENISDEWVDILDTTGPKDHITVFYTDKSSHINCGQVCKLMEKGAGKVHWIKCLEGNNALDFQLVTELGAMIERNEAEEYAIISKDNGFNVVVNYWNSRNIHITRMNVKAIKDECVTKDEADIAVKVPQTTPVVHPAAKTEEPAFIRELLKTVDISDHSMLYGTLVAFEGQGNGAEDYRRIRDYDKDVQARLSGLYLKDRGKRGVTYLELLLRQNQHPETEGAQLYDMVMNGPKKKKDKFHKSLITRYGKDEGTVYYRMIKPHYNFIKMI